MHMKPYIYDINITY